MPEPQGVAVSLWRGARLASSEAGVLPVAAHARLRDSVYSRARAAIRHDAVSQVKYGALRARGDDQAPRAPARSRSPRRRRLCDAQKPDLLPA